MAAHLGNTLKAYICSGADDVTNIQDAIWLGCETSNTLNRAQEAVECSDKSTDWAKFIKAKRSGTFEVTVYADNDDPGQKEAIISLTIGGVAHFAVGVAGNDDFTDMEYGDCIVTAVSDVNDFGACSTRTVSLQLKSPLRQYPEEPEPEEDDNTPTPAEPAEPNDPDAEENG